MKTVNFSPILTTSGFILPDNKYFEQLDSMDVFFNEYLGGPSLTGLNRSLSDVIDQGLISTSKIASEAYLEYISNPNFDSYILLVDIVSEVFRNISYLDLLKLQVNNSFLSPMGFKMLLELPCHNKISSDFSSYSMLPSFLIGQHNFNHKELSTREGRIKELEGTRGRFLEAPVVIQQLLSFRESFLTFFKLVLTSSLR